MRISILERNDRRKAPRRRRRGRRHRTLETAISQPLRQPGRKAASRPAPSRRSRAEPPPQPRAAAPTVQIQVPEWLVKGVKRLNWPSILILAVLIGLLVYASVDRRFFIYEAQILGSRHLPAEAIYARAGIHEQNIFWVNPRTVSQQVGQLDGIKAVKVRCALPARVTIEVEERQPAALLRSTSQGRDWWLDEEGLVLPYHGDPMAGDAVFIIDRSGQELAPGARVEPQNLIWWVRQIAASVPGVRLFYYHPDKGLSFSDAAQDHDWLVYIGNGEDLPRKLRALDVVTDYLIANDIHPLSVDVRWPTRPVYRLPDGAAGQGSQ